MKHLFKLFIISTILFFTTSAFGNQWKIDPAHSEVRFQVKHIHTNTEAPDKAQGAQPIDVRQIEADIGNTQPHIDQAKARNTVEANTAD